jgi:hypothetical protein
VKMDCCSRRALIGCLIADSSALRIMARLLYHRSRTAYRFNAWGSIRQPLLGLAPLTPHDLRRTPASMCGNLGLSESGISQCLDHQAIKGEDGQPLPAITSKVYNLSVIGRVERKRKVLDAGPSNCGASSAMFLWRAWSGCLPPDPNADSNIATEQTNQPHIQSATSLPSPL